MATNKDLFNARVTLDAVLARRLETKDSRQFAKLIKPVVAAIGDINDKRDRMLAYHHATLSPDGRQYIFTDEARPRFYKEWDELMQEETAIKFAPLGDEWIDKLGMSAGEVALLSFLFAGE